MKPNKEWWWEWKTIDGNWAKNPVAYCKSKKGALTHKLIKVHGCRRKHCCSFDDTVEFEQKRSV